MIEVTSPTYVAPATLAEVLDVLAEYQDEAKLLAGGQSLLVLLRQGLIRPSVLVSLRHVQELRGLSTSADGGLQIGAAVTQAQLAREGHLKTYYTALSDAAGLVATRQVRTLGTLGGNLCHADPTADPPAALIALGALVEIVGPRGPRQVDMEAFFRNFMEVDLAADEVLVRVVLPAPLPGSGSAYLKHRLRDVDTALVGAAVWVQLEPGGDRIRNARVGLAGAGATPLRSHPAEEALLGAAAAPDSFVRASAAAAAACAPLSDTEASEWYRRQMVRVFLHRAGARALDRARQDSQASGRVS